MALRPDWAEAHSNLASPLKELGLYEEALAACSRALALKPDLVEAHGNRALTLQVNAINLLNAVQWATVDTNINSPTFGWVTSARPMRTVTVTARFRY